MKDELIDTFLHAQISNSKYVFVKIEAEGTEECIVIPRKSFYKKQNFYKGAYDENLIHVMNSKVKITDFVHGNSDCLLQFI